MNITDREKKLIYFVAVFAIVALSFYFGYMRITDATTDLKNEYVENNAIYSRLSILNNKLDEYRNDISEFETEYEQLLAHYTADNSQEYMIVFLSKLEKETGVWFTDTTFGETSEVYGFGEYKTSNTSDSAYVNESDLKGYATSVTVSYQATYEEIKDFVAYIKNYREKYSIDSISMSYQTDSEIVTGTIQLTQYAIVGSRDYTPVSIPTVPTGTTNIFRSNSFRASSSYLEEAGASIMYDYDLYMILNSEASDVDSVIVGVKDEDSTIVSTNSNKIEEVMLTITGENGNYRARYSVGEKKYPEANYDIGAEVSVGKTLDMLVISSKKNDIKDVSGAKVTINNQSDLTLNIKIVNDDEYSPRFTLYAQSGSIKTY